MREKINIVIADDCLEDQTNIKAALVKAGLNFEISSVYNGIQLMDFLMMTNSYAHNENNIPDLILLDIGMPFMDGFEALKGLKSNPLLTAIPVYVISKSTNERDNIKAEIFGAKKLFVKPASTAGYQKIIEEIVTENEFQTFGSQFV